MKIGDIVYANLTRTETMILDIVHLKDFGVSRLNDTLYIIADPYMNGERYAWELTILEDEC